MKYLQSNWSSWPYRIVIIVLSYDFKVDLRSEFNFQVSCVSHFDVHGNISQRYFYRFVKWSNIRYNVSDTKTMYSSP